MAHAKDTSRGLVRELLHTQRVAALVLLVMLLVSLGSSGYLLLASQSRLAGYIDLSFHVRNVHRSMLDQETGLRGWLATGNLVFLEPYDAGLEESEVESQALLAAVAEQSTAELAEPVLEMLLARQSWQRWASEASTTTFNSIERDGGDLTAFLLEGKSLFDSYRVSEEPATDLIISRRDGAVGAQQQALVLTLLVNLVVLLGMALWLLHRRRTVRSRYVEPFDTLLESIDGMRAGDLTLRTQPSGVQEIDAIGAQLQSLASDLGVARSEAAAREARLALLAERFRMVVRVGREISGSLNVGYVSQAVTSSAADLLLKPTTLWVRGEDGHFHASSRSQDAHGAWPPDDLVAPPVVAVVATEAQVASLEGRRAYPLVLAGMVVGVLETEAIADTEVDEDTEQVLSALLSTAAAALESAHLHSTAREQADQDGLTGLANRRRFEVDVDDEWQRCRRYGRPLSVVMVDLDHFKRLNDEHGHQLGDEVLRAASAALAGVLRSSDTAYRYGGEEFVVMLRETGIEEAAAVAERMRHAVAGVTIATSGLLVSASAGVAERHASMGHHTELVAAADAALYEAKRSGRDRVHAAL